MSAEKDSISSKLSAHNGGDRNAAQSATTSSTALPPLTFQSLSSTVHVYRPPVRSSASSSATKTTTTAAASNTTLQPIRTRAAPPRVVVVMGWMNAPLRIVTKYAAPYAILFPAATIIVKLSTGVSFVRSRQAQLAALESVAQLVCDAEASNAARAALRTQVAQLEGSAKQAGLTMDVDAQNTLQDKVAKGETISQRQDDGNDSNGVFGSSGMLIHSFSDGGAYNVSQLLRLLQKRTALSPLAHIMDSSPGKASPRSGSTAMTMSLAHRPLARFIVRMAMYMYLNLIYAFKALTGRKTWSRIMRERLNTPSVWSWPSSTGERRASDKLPPRLYLYSKTDALIDYRAVEEHAQLAAQTNGIGAAVQVRDLAKNGEKWKAPLVALQRWDNGVQHCDIGRSDFDGYWGAVRAFLDHVL